LWDCKSSYLKGEVPIFITYDGFLLTIFFFLFSELLFLLEFLIEKDSNDFYRFLFFNVFIFAGFLDSDSASLFAFNFKGNDISKAHAFSLF
jgi:hypothetical protein